MEQWTTLVNNSMCFIYLYIYNDFFFPFFFSTFAYHFQKSMRQFFNVTILSACFCLFSLTSTKYSICMETSHWTGDSHTSSAFWHLLCGYICGTSACLRPIDPYAWHQSKSGFLQKRWEDKYRNERGKKENKIWIFWTIVYSLSMNSILCIDRIW